MLGFGKSVFSTTECTEDTEEEKDMLTSNIIGTAWCCIRRMKL